RRLALAGADDEVSAAGDGPRARGERLHRLLHGARRRERRRHACIASHTRSGVIGSRRTRAPVACAIAFAIAPGVGTLGGSPIPFDPLGPAFRAGISIQAMSILGASAAVTSL